MENKNIKIKEAGEADIQVIQKIAAVAFPDTYKDLISREQIDFMMNWMYSTESLVRQMTVDGHTYLIVSEEDRPVGYVSVQPVEEGVVELQKIYVLPGCQGQGLGRRLFDEAVGWIRSNGYAPCRMELHVNRHNKALLFYEHLGMRKLRQGDFDIGSGFQMNDYIMGINID